MILKGSEAQYSVADCKLWLIHASSKSSPIEPAFLATSNRAFQGLDVMMKAKRCFDMRQTHTCPVKSIAKLHIFMCSRSCGAHRVSEHPVLEHEGSFERDVAGPEKMVRQFDIFGQVLHHEGIPDTEERRILQRRRL
jgi:hypothetical protein